MGLTKPRASQIFDLDYKQATRVITVSNVTLTGGAPAVVDGVSLTAGDRVLVTGQSTGSENGLYTVSSVGVGSDGTWVRTSDGNDDGEIQAGMIVMVTEGATYADTQWKLTTNGTIDIGTTALVFAPNTSESYGNAEVATYLSSGTVSTNILTTAAISATGNVTGTYILGDGSQLTNLPTADGTLEVDARGGTVNVPVTSGGGGGGVDSAGVSEIIVSDVDAAFINALTIDADTLGGQNSAYHLDYGNFTNTPTIPSVLTDLGISDGTADQVLTTNGAGTFTFTTVSVGWVETSATYDATAGSKLFVDTSSSAVQVNLPASPSMGDEVYVVDAAGNSGTYNITVNRNGNKITGLDENFTIDINGAAIILAYYNATRGWIVISK